MVKILFTRFPFESRLGGAEIQTISLMKGLVERGHALAFAGSCPTLLKLCKENFIPALKWDIGPPPVTKWTTISFFWRAFSMKKSLKQLLAQFSDVDAICMLSLSEKLLLTHIAHDQKKKILWIEHDRIGRWLRKNPYLGWLRKQSNLATIITVSDLSKRLMEELGFDGSRIKSIPNGTDEKRFPRLPSPLPRGEGMFVVGCVARLTHDKGVHVLIESIKNLPDVRLKIVGDGPQRHALKESDQVTIVPTVNDLGTFYRSVDMLVLPSIDNDPFGMAPAEAMLCGTPVIVTDQCGIAGYLENEKDALIVPANDSDALQQAIHHLKNTASLRQPMGENGRKTAEDKFSLHRMVDSYEKILA